MRLELKGITKRFGSFTANDAIDLVVEPGEIHCLLGENGAGKSTLMNTLFGLYQPDEGEILVDGAPVTFHDPGDAMKAGIGMVHQHFMLVPVFTVAENVMLGHEQVKGPFLDLASARAQVRELSARYNLAVDPDALVEDLPVGVQQRVEIIKALVLDAQVLILDEPTAVLTPQETDELLEIIRQLKSVGRSIVLISHKLREIRAVADRITVIRRGKVVGTTLPSESESALAAAMVGRAVSLTVAKGPAEPGDVVLDVEGLTVRSATGVALVDAVDLRVHAGEVVCIAGVQGNGQTELTEAVLGLADNVTGSVRLGGTQLVGRSTRQILDAGIGFVPEDRSHDGLIATFSLAENLVLDQYGHERFSSGIRLRRDVIRTHAETAVAEFDVRTKGVDEAAATLSGGNQQKLVLARELSKEISLFIAAQPTRGVDVGAIEFVHRRVIEQRDAGTAVLIVSTELDEVAALADRIAVMYAGRIIGIVGPGTSRRVLGLMMAGVPAHLDEQAEDEVEPAPEVAGDSAPEAEPGPDDGPAAEEGDSQ